MNVKGIKMKHLIILLAALTYACNEYTSVERLSSTGAHSAIIEASSLKGLPSPDSTVVLRNKHSNDIIGVGYFEGSTEAIYFKIFGDSTAINVVKQDGTYSDSVYVRFNAEYIGPSRSGIKSI